MSTLQVQVEALSYAQSMIKLMSFGWTEFIIPRCYTYPFGKGKVCLYLHAPPNLAKENYDHWVQTVLECYLTPVSYEQLPASKKYASKPRFTPFTVSANALRDVSYKGPNLPMVVALGDAQIDSEYALGHGIYNGISRIDVLLDVMSIKHGNIEYFDTQGYLQTIRKLLCSHKEDIIEHSIKESQSLSKARERARLKFRQALMMSTDDVEKANFNTILKKLDAGICVDARQNYATACEDFAVFHDKNYHINLKVFRSCDWLSRLSNLHVDLLVALVGLPQPFETERHHILDLLVHLAVSWKIVGNVLDKDGRISDAINAYHNANTIYTLAHFKGRYIGDELTIHSYLGIMYNKEKRYSKAIAIVKKALHLYESYQSDVKPVARFEKLIRTLIRALCAEAYDQLDLNHKDAAHLFHAQAKEIIIMHEGSLSSQTSLIITTIMDGLQKSLDQVVRREQGSLLQIYSLFSTAPSVDHGMPFDNGISFLA